MFCIPLFCLLIHKHLRLTRLTVLLLFALNFISWLYNFPLWCTYSLNFNYSHIIIWKTNEEKTIKIEMLSTKNLNFQAINVQKLNLMWCVLGVRKSNHFFGVATATSSTIPLYKILLQVYDLLKIHYHLLYCCDSVWFI